jgi:hypothetical protein
MSESVSGSVLSNTSTILTTASASVIEPRVPKEEALIALEVVVLAVTGIIAMEVHTIVVAPVFPSRVTLQT